MNRSRTTKCVAICGLFAVGVGCLVLVGWAADVVWIKSVVPGLTAMNPASAICFAMVGSALCLLRKPTTDRSWMLVAKAAATAVALVGSLRLTAYLFGAEFQIDRMLFAASLGDNRMAPNTAICFCLTGLSLLLLDLRIRGGYWLAQGFVFLIATVSLISLVGYGYGARAFYHVASHTPMALNTAALFELLAIGILLARPDRGLVSIVLNPGPGGMIARRLLPAIIGIPCLIGWLRVLGQQLGLYDTEFGAAFMVASTIVLLFIAVSWIAAALNRADQAREQTLQELRRSEQTVRQFNEVLEQRVKDRTDELAIANADLVHKNRENELFVYSVSHDLRSPLVNLQGFSKELSAVSQNLRDLLVSESVPHDVQKRGVGLVDDDMQRCVRFIQSAVSRLSGIIDALLRLSRAGRVEYQPQPVDVEATITRIVESMSGTIYDRGASLETGRLPAAWGDPTALEQVFANLIGNAVNYLDPNRPGRIEIGSEESVPPADDSRRWTTYYIKDNGLGIPEAYHSKVFQALKRLHPEVAKGEGIGLAIVRRIVERHGGIIRFESTAGSGTTFFVTLPNAEINSQSQYPNNVPIPPRSTSHADRSVGNPVGGR